MKEKGKVAEQDEKVADELIKITENKGKNVVSARELHEFLEVTERFSPWFDRQLQYGFEQSVDYQGCEVFNTLANQTLMDYAITIDMAKELSMLQRTDKGKQARKYFIECEKDAKKQNFIGINLKEEEKKISLLKSQISIAESLYKNGVVDSIGKSSYIRDAMNSIGYNSPNYFISDGDKHLNKEAPLFYEYMISNPILNTTTFKSIISGYDLWRRGKGGSSVSPVIASRILVELGYEKRRNTKGVYFMPI